MTKISVTIDDEVLERARDNAPEGNLSAYVNEAVAARNRREALRAVVELAERERGRPFTREELDEARRRWLD